MYAASNSAAAATSYSVAVTGMTPLAATAGTSSGEMMTIACSSFVVSSSDVVHSSNFVGSSDIVNNSDIIDTTRRGQ
eukprot:scaffold13840_cov35-Attheya_sp.AAC.1